MKRKIHLLIGALLLIFSFGIFEPVAAQISGKIIDSRGNPLNEILIELIPAELASKPTRYEIQDEMTDKNGLFEFENIKEGKYVLAVGYVWTPSIDDPYPTTFYPGVTERSQASVIEIKPNNFPQNILLQLPAEMTQLDVRGKILLINGKPAVNAHVRLHNQESQLVVSDCRTDENGNFFLKGFVGDSYHIEADNFKGVADVWDFDSSKPFVLERNLKNFRLILKSAKGKFKKQDQQPNN